MFSFYLTSKGSYFLLCIAEMSFISLPELLLKSLNEHPNSISYYERDNQDNFIPSNNTALRSAIMNIAKSLIKLDFQKSDRICIMANTTAKWVQCHFGSQFAGGTAAGIYMTSNNDEVRFILEDTRPKILVLESLDLFKRVQEIVEEKEILVVLMNGSLEHDLVLQWEAFLSVGLDVEEDEVMLRIEGITQKDVATLIYTSGTTGVPKCVMMSTENCEFVGRILTSDFVKAFGCPERCDYVSYMPLCHVAEQVFAIYGPACGGNITNWFCPKMEDLERTLREVRPHILFGPPLLWEEMYAKIKSELPKGVSLSILDEDTKRPIREAIGLDRCKLALTGDAPVSPTTLTFFSDLGIPLKELYGQSEGTLICCNMPDKTLIGSLGPPVKDTEIKIAEDGEIMYRGPQVFLGYWNQPDKTAKVKTADGFVHSGDIGEFDDEGYLHILGRKKDMITTTTGIIMPVPIENMLKAHSLIESAVVIGEGRPYLSVLISLDSDIISSSAKKQNISSEELILSPQLENSIQSIIEEVNATLNPEHHLKAYKILDEPISVSNNSMTSTMKVRRHKVNDIYAQEIESLYS